jgi:hypothetical protein
VFSPGLDGDRQAVEPHTLERDNAVRAIVHLHAIAYGDGKPDPFVQSHVSNRLWLEMETPQNVRVAMPLGTSRKYCLSRGPQRSLWHGFADNRAGDEQADETCLKPSELGIVAEVVEQGTPRRNFLWGHQGSQLKPHLLGRDARGPHGIRHVAANAREYSFEAPHLLEGLLDGCLHRDEILGLHGRNIRSRTRILKAALVVQFGPEAHASGLRPHRCGQANGYASGGVGGWPRTLRIWGRRRYVVCMRAADGGRAAKPWSSVAMSGMPSLSAVAACTVS